MAAAAAEGDDLRRTMQALEASVQRRRGKPARQRAVLDVARRCRLLEQQVPLFSRLTRRQLRVLLAKMEVVVHEAGEAVVVSGATADAIVVVEQGGVLCDSTGAEARRGQALGAMEMLMDLRHSSTMVAVERTVVLKLRKRDAKPIVERCWGTRAEILKRKDLLVGVPLFAGLPEAAVLGLTTALRREVYAHGTAICTEGRFADCMHIVVAGCVVVHSREHGRLTTLGPGEHFGEVGILADQSWRTATVRAHSDSCIDESTECFRLHRRDVQHLLTSDQCAAALATARAAYEERAAVRQSDSVRDVLDRFFDLLAVAAEADASIDGAPQTWGVSQGGYSHLHMLVTRILPSGLNDADAKMSARNDWAEDVVSFQTGEKVNAALEAAKAQLRGLVESAIEREGWGLLGEDRADATEFVRVCREELHVPETTLSDQVLADIFAQGERSVVFGGGLSGPEFARWLSGVRGDDGATVVTPVRSAVSVLRKASKSEITKCGWEQAFMEFNGTGELEFDEFAVLVQRLGAQPTVFSRQLLRQVFRHIDSSRSGHISSAQLCRWIEHAPMDQLMSVESFAEGLLQLSQLWVEKVDSVDAKAPDRDYRFLLWLFEAVTCLDGDGGDDGDKRRLKRFDEILTSPRGSIRQDSDLHLPAEAPVVESKPSSAGASVALSVPSDKDPEPTEKIEPPAAAPTPSPPLASKSRQRQPLFVWEHQRTASADQQPQHAKELNPNRIFYSKHQPGVGQTLKWKTVNALGASATPGRTATPPARSKMDQEKPSLQQADGLSVVVVEADENFQEVDARDPAANGANASRPSSARHQWSIKHHPSSSRQARRTTGSGGLLGRMPHAPAYASPPSPVAEIVIRPNTCSDWLPPTFAVAAESARGGAQVEKAGGKNHRVSRSAPPQRLIIKAAPLEQEETPGRPSSATELIVFDRRHPDKLTKEMDGAGSGRTSRPLVARRSASASPSVSARGTYGHPELSAHAGTGGRAAMEQIRQRPVTAPAPGQRGRRLRGADEEEEEQRLELGMAWLATAEEAQRGGSRRATNAFRVSAGAGGSERTRPEAIARLHLMSVESRGPMRAGRVDTRPHSARPHREIKREILQMEQTRRMPRLSRVEVETMIAGAHSGATLTELQQH